MSRVAVTATINPDRTGTVTPQPDREFQFSVEGGYLTVVSDDGDVICEGRPIRRSLNNIEILAIAVEEVGAYVS